MTVQPTSHHGDLQAATTFGAACGGRSTRGMFARARVPRSRDAGHRSIQGNGRRLATRGARGRGASRRMVAGVRRSATRRTRGAAAIVEPGPARRARALRAVAGGGRAGPLAAVSVARRGCVCDPGSRFCRGRRRTRAQGADRQRLRRVARSRVGDRPVRTAAQCDRRGEPPRRGERGRPRSARSRTAG